MDTLGPLLISLRDAAYDRLVECERAPALVTLAPGNNVAWDNCCENGGELWVRVLSILPQPAGSQPCDVTDLQARIAVGVIRCMHGLQEEGPPTAAEMTGDTLAMTADASALFHAIQDWEPTAILHRKTLRIEQGTPLGPNGFCGGWEWTLSFRYSYCSVGC